MADDKPIKVKYVVIDGLMKSDLPDVIALAEGVQVVGDDKAVRTVGAKPVERTEVRAAVPDYGGAVPALADVQVVPALTTAEVKMNVAGKNATEQTKLETGVLEKLDEQEPAEEEATVKLITKCSVCHAPQVMTASGATCKNGHRGAKALEEDEEPQAAAEPEPEVEAAPEEKPAPPPAKTANGKSANGTAKQTLPVALMTTSKVKDVVVYVVQQGAKTPEQVVAACLALKGKIPVLGKVSNLEERVRRILETLND